MGQTRQRQDWQAEHAQQRALVVDALVLGVIGDGDGGNFPARALGAAVLSFHRAAGKGGIVEHHIAVCSACPAARGKAAALAQHQQEIFDRTGLELVGQLDLFGIEHVAGIIDEADVAAGLDLPGLAVPRDDIGAHGLHIAPQDDIARGGYRFGIAGIGHAISLEANFGGCACLFGRWWRWCCRVRHLGMSIARTQRKRG